MVSPKHVYIRVTVIIKKQRSHGFVEGTGRVGGEEGGNDVNTMLTCEFLKKTFIRREQQTHTDNLNRFQWYIANQVCHSELMHYYIWANINHWPI